MAVLSKMINGVKRYYIVLPNGRWKFVKKPKWLWLLNAVLVQENYPIYIVQTAKD